MNPQAATPTQLTQQLAEAVEAEDIQQAKQLLDRLGDAADPRLLKAIAGLCLNQCEWSDAADTFARISNPDSELPDADEAGSQSGRYPK